MSDLAISGTALGAGAALGTLTAVATRSATGSAIGAATGMALGGLAAAAATREGREVDPMSPSVAVPMLAGAGAGIAAAWFLGLGSLGSAPRDFAILGATALGGGLAAVALANAPWT